MNRVSVPATAPPKQTTSFTYWIFECVHSEKNFPVPTRICLSEEDFQLEIGPREYLPMERGISAWYNVKKIKK